MAQNGLAAIIEYKRKLKEAQDAAEGKTPKEAPAVTGLKAAVPKEKPAEKPVEKPAPPKPPAPYVPIKDKTAEEKAQLAEEMKAEMELRAARAKAKAKK